MENVKRKIGRPSIYGFEALEVGELTVRRFENSDDCTRMRRAALAHARRFGKFFSTTKKQNVLHVKRTS